MTSAFYKAKHMMGKALLCMFTFIFAVCMCAGSAWAAPEVPTPPDLSFSLAGNIIGSSNDNTISMPGQKVEHDLYWAGADMTFSEIELGGDAVVAGKNIVLQDIVAGGSTRVAGKDITLSNVKVQDNFTVAGQNIDFSACEAQGGVYAACEDFKFSGKAAGGAIAGKNVVLDGVIDGDIIIYGSDIEIGPNAVVSGTLTVKGPSEPTVKPGANVPSIKYEPAESSATMDISEAIATLGAAVAMLTIVTKVIGIIGTILFAILLAWLFRRTVESAAALTRKYAGRIFATGAITAVAAPVLFLILLCLVVTAPIAMALLFVLIAMAMISVPFAAASFARLVFPKMNHIGSAALGGLILGVAAAIPFLGTIINIAAFMYIAGYAIQALWQGRKA